jgi:hypothetical protein
MMPRSLQEILPHAEELGRRFHDHEPDVVRTAKPLHPIRDAVTDRATAERGVAQSAAAAREPGASWTAIASMLGTSGEAARMRCATHPPASA